MRALALELAAFGGLALAILGMREKAKTSDVNADAYRRFRQWALKGAVGFLVVIILGAPLLLI